LKKTFLFFVLGAVGIAQKSNVTYPGNISGYTYTGPITAAKPPAVNGKNLTGKVQVAIKLQDAPLVVAVGVNAKQNGITMTAAQQIAYLASINQKQNVVMQQVAAMGGVELGRVSKAHNALAVSVDASMLQAIHAIGGVVAVRPLADLQYTSAPVPDLPTTDSYIGASAVQASGFTGQGVRVALLDTGIDYTHYNLGGSGNVADYNAAAAVASGTPPANLFPTSKVVGGFDFTGDVWPNGPLTIDANPLDLNGHGSHTSDILGGKSLDGLHVGTAPGTQLYAVKVCSSVSTSCSGVAILEGLDFALDPTGSGTLNNAVDIISMSIGGAFGQREDDESEAFTDIVNFGVLSVISAGNDGDVPYILAQPGSTPEALTLAATTSVVGTDIPLVIGSPASIAGTYTNTATLDFAPINSAVTGNIVYVGRGCPADSVSPGSSADPYIVNPSGKIALIDRGACSVSLKIDAAANAGAIAVLIGLVAPGDAVGFAVGGGSNFPPSLVITQSAANVIKTAVGTVTGSISPNNAISLATNVASFSSRGPTYSYNTLKPDMSAPGTIEAAQPGTGNGQTTESGTSFSAPTAAGVAALLLSKNHALAPLDVKALLIETAETNVFQNAATQPGALAPMSRMGGGEVRADRAIAASTAVWDSTAPLAVTISFGTYRLNANQSFKKKIVVKNYSNASRTYQISNTYRDAPNTTGATISTPSSITVAANSTNSFTLTLTVNAASLPVWTLNGGSNGSNGELLNTVEYAGFLTVTGGPDTVHIPWHILPHQAANIQPATNTVTLSGNPQTLTLPNTNGAANGLVDAFSLTGTGVQFPPSVLPAPGADFAVINLQAAGVRLVCIDQSNPCTTFGVQFAITTFGQRSHPDVPAEFDIHLDLNHDGADDLVIFNQDIGFATTGTTFSGQNGVFVFDLGAGAATGPYFFTIADLDSANAIFTVPLSALTTQSGLALQTSTMFTFSVLAFDNYFTGNLTDAITGMQYELDMPQFYAQSEFTVPANSSTNLTIFPNNAATPFLNGPYNGNSPSQTGILLLYQNAKTGQESSQVVVHP
jgi:subtilisin family serine protease